MSSTDPASPSQAGRAPDLTVVIPVFNEEENIGPVIDEVLATIADHSAELLIIDDGSEDGTSAVVQGRAADNSRLRFVLHPNRAGKSAALRTGALHARGRWMATMDGDGQDDPKDMLALTREVDLTTIGAVGVVGGVRKQRTDGANRKWASRFANKLRRTLLNDDCPDTACGLKLMPVDVFLSLPFFDALHRYFPALIQHFGYEARYVPVDNRPRAHGSSKYSNLGRAAAGFFDLMGVMWLMRRTHYPSKELLLRPDENAK
ncbi:MAG: glycosyltransferase family 2 protein [Pseudomonadota bacterium]